MNIIKKSFIMTALLATIFVSPAFAEKKIAVLPFNIPNENPEMKQFSYGTMAVLDHTLNEMPEYTLINRGQIDSVLKEIGFQKTGFTDETTSIKIGKLSGVDILVLGTIQVSNNNYRVNVNVTDVQTGKIIKTFQVTGTEMFQLQDQLSGQLLTLNASNDSNSRSTGNPASFKKTNKIIKTTFPEAYTLYSQAKDSLKEFDNDHLESAIELFDRSVAIDNKYTDAIYGKLEAQSVYAFMQKEEGKDYSALLSTIKATLSLIPDSDKENSEIHFANYFIAKIENNNSLESLIANKLIKIAKNDYVNTLNILGNYYRENHKSTQAINILNESIRIDPSNIYSYFALAIAYGQQNRKKEIELYNQILKMNPNFAAARVNLGGMYLYEHNYAEAIHQYELVLKIEPDSSVAHFSLGQIYYLQQKTDLAIEEIKKAIVLKKTFTYSYLLLGDIYLKQGKNAEALESYKNALEFSNNKANAYEKIANFYSKQKNYSEALNNYNKALEIDPKSSDLHSSMASNYFADKKYEQAISEYKLAIEYGKQEYSFSIPYYYNSLGSIYKELKRYDEALATFQEGNKFDDKDESLYFDIAEVYQLMGKPEEAINSYKQLLKLKPDTGYAYVAIADLYHSQKNYVEALKYSNNFLAIKHSDSREKEIKEIMFDSLMNMGVVSQTSGKNDEAINYYTEALKIKPDLNVYNNLGAAYYTKGKYQDAINQYKSALEIKADHPDSHNNLGIVYQVLGYKSESDAEYKKACDLGLKSSCK